MKKHLFYQQPNQHVLYYFKSKCDIRQFLFFSSIFHALRKWSKIFVLHHSFHSSLYASAMSSIHPSLLLFCRSFWSSIFIHLATQPSIQISIYLSTRLHIRSSIQQSALLTIRLPVRPSTHLLDFKSPHSYSGCLKKHEQQNSTNKGRHVVSCFKTEKYFLSSSLINFLLQHFIYNDGFIVFLFL